MKTNFLNVYVPSTPTRSQSPEWPWSQICKIFHPIVSKFNYTGCIRAYLYLFSKKKRNEKTLKHPVLSNSQTIVLSTLFRIFGFSCEMAVRGIGTCTNDIRENKILEIDIRDLRNSRDEFGNLDCNHLACIEYVLRISNTHYAYAHSLNW